MNHLLGRFVLTGALLIAAGISRQAAGQVLPLAPTSPGPLPVERGEAILPEAIPDPLEPINRGLWEFNKGAMIYVVKPTAKGYRLIIRKPIRTGISNIGRNLQYPSRVINNVLQERWTGARDETYRFLANSTIGLAGIFDVASKWGVPKSEADFGQTFGKWGWRPHIYLMIPLLGPSSERDGLGQIASMLVNPLTYFPPYSYVTYEINYNNLTDSVEDYVRLIESEMDPYASLKYLTSLTRDTTPVNWEVTGPPDEAALETIQSVFFTFSDPHFPEMGKTRSVKLNATGKEFDYSLWLQPNTAPLVYINPGIGSHRLARATVALAELLYTHGYSVVATSSTFNSEFIEEASTAALPGYSPVDTADLRAALTDIDHSLAAEFGNRIGHRALLGYSMGGFQTLFLAANQGDGIKFERYVGLDTPVRLLYGVSKLDQFYSAPLKWAPEERPARVRNTLLKASSLAQAAPAADAKVPFDAVESEFLVGGAFRLILRDMIYFTQSRTNLGILKAPVSKWRREPVYREIMTYSFTDYLARFVTTYYESRGIPLRSLDALAEASDLRKYSDALAHNNAVRVVENANDILITPDDVAWYKSTFGDRVTVFEHGGHLGNFAVPEVQKAILATLQGLGDERPAASN
jgi:ABC-type transporter lipoprotein component MlaA